MLDKNTQILLKTITSQIQDESYKVIDNDDFLNQFRSGRVNEEGLNAMMLQLQKGGYIDIKYNDNQKYCLAVKPKAREMKEEVQLDNREIRKLKRMLFWVVVLSGLSAFAGTWAAIYLFLGR